MQQQPLQAAYHPRITTGVMKYLPLTIGDVIRKARTGKRWNQETLGEKAGEFLAPGGRNPPKIGKNTVSAVEHNPYTSDFETVCRILAALGMTLAEAERRAGPVVHPATPPSETRREGTQRRRSGTSDDRGAVGFLAASAGKAYSAG